MAAGPSPADRARAARAGAGRLGDGPDHDGRRDAGSDRRLRRVDEDEAPDGRRGQRVGRHHARARPPGAHRRDRHRHRRRGRHRRRRRQHRQPVDDGGDRGAPPPGCRWSSTATAQRRRCPAGRTRSRRSACASTWAPTRWRAASPRSASGSASRRSSTRRYRYAGAARREIGVPTVFNLLGPLTNPASPRAGLIGCAFGDLAEVMAGVFAAAPLQCAGGARRRRPRRADHHHDVDDLAGAGRHHRPADVRPGRVRFRPRRICPSWSAVTPNSNAAEARSVFAGATGPGARRGDPQRGGGDGRPRRAVQFAPNGCRPGRPGCPALRRRSTPGPPASCWPLGAVHPVALIRDRGQRARPARSAAEILLTGDLGELFGGHPCRARGRRPGGPPAGGVHRRRPALVDARSGCPVRPASGPTARSPRRVRRPAGRFGARMVCAPRTDRVDDGHRRHAAGGVARRGQLAVPHDRQVPAAGAVRLGRHQFGDRRQRAQSLPAPQCLDGDSGVVAQPRRALVVAALRPARRPGRRPPPARSRRPRRSGRRPAPPRVRSPACDRSRAAGHGDTSCSGQDGPC